MRVLSIWDAHDLVFFAFRPYKVTIWKMIPESLIEINTIHKANSKVVKIYMGLLCEYGQLRSPSLLSTVIRGNR